MKALCLKNLLRIFYTLLAIWIFISLTILRIWLNSFAGRRKANDVLPSSQNSAVSGEENLTPAKNRLLFIAILTHWRQWRRREGIRKTWMTECSSSDEVMCLFFTDAVGTKERERRILMKEISEHNDTVLMMIPEEMQFAFGYRLLWILEWTTNRSEFKYFLRIDDDHFLCLERLLNELKWRPQTALYWGFIHCRPGIVRVDEAWLMLTRDLVVEILDKKNTTLPCHPMGDQSVALWMNNSTYNITYFMDNARIVHKTAGHDPRYYARDVCERFLSLHGVFDVEMRRFWLVWHKLYRRRLKESPRYKVTSIPQFETVCGHSKAFSTDGFYPEFRFDPRPCRLNPVWSISKSEHPGREKTGERYSSY